MVIASCVDESDVKRSSMECGELPLMSIIGAYIWGYVSVIKE
jgi:hypothetical protein